MTTTTTRLALTAIALAATVAMARAQAPDPHHPPQPDAAQTNAAIPAPTPPAGSMPIGLGATPGQAASAVGGGMGQMKTIPEMMRAMTAGGMGGDAGGMGMTPEMMGGMMRGMMGGEPGMGGMGMMRGMMEARGMGMATDHIEGRIAYLKAELKITDAQAAAWSTLADAMRANATAMKGMQGQMGDGMPASWPARLTMQQKMMSGHLAAVTGLEAAVTPLYAVLSEDQRATLDEAMAGPKGKM